MTIHTTHVDVAMKYKPYHLYRGGLYEYYQAEAEEGLKMRIEDYDDKARIWHSIFMQHLPSKEEVPSIGGEKRALELGCNTGYNVKEYEKIYGNAVGIDSNQRLIQASMLNSPNCHWQRAEWLQFDDDSVSVVLAKDVYEHCKHPEQAISETYRVLADGGYVLAMIPLDGENVKVDDVHDHPVFYYGNYSHVWKATARGVVSRFFKHGFTDVEVWIYNHAQLFGESRAFGDNVMVIKAVKKEGITMVPDLWLLDNPYWAAFLTFMCSGNCDYCIQDICKDEFMKAKAMYNRGALLPNHWVDFYNNVQKWKNQRIGILGGEPTMYPGFFDVVNGLDGYYKTITTNLKTRAFENIAEFTHSIVSKENFRINTSFHPSIISVDEFAGKIHQLRESGFEVDQIAMVDHPLVNFKKYHNEFVKRGIALTPQTFLGKVGDELLPNPDAGIGKDYGEHGINNYPLYEKGFSCEEKSEILCMTRRFMVAPDGGIYKCHYHIYSRRNTLGNIKDLALPELNAFEGCGDFGYCNPCDFPHATFKEVNMDVPSTLSVIINDRDMIEALLEYFNDHTSPEFHQVMYEVLGILYCSDDPYWSIYNDARIKELINSYLLDQEIWDNTKERYFAQLDGSLFRFLPQGVNVYRILDEVPMLKYADALGHVIFSVLSEHHPAVLDFCRIPGIAKALDTLIANTQTTASTANMSDGSICIWRKNDGSKEEETEE